MSSSHRRRVPVVSAAVLGSLLAALALTASAQMFKQSRSNLDQLTFSKRELRVTQTLADADAIKGLITNRDAMTQFRSQYGAAWRFLIDERTGRLNLLEGGAIPFIPGAANKLQLEGVTGECRTASCVPAAKIISLAKDFLARNKAVLQVNPDELVPDPVGVVPIGNSIYFVRFQWVHGGIPVEGGSVFLAINNGNLIQVGVQDIGSINLDPKATITTEKAWEVVSAYVKGINARDQRVEQGSLSIIPITPKGMDPDSAKVSFGKMIDYALVFKLAFRRPEVSGVWEALVDAHTGELLRFRDGNIYGHVEGGVYKTDVPQVEVNVAFPKADYSAGNYADALGNFPGVAGTSTLTGLNAGSMGNAGGVRITENCGAISRASNAAGYINFGSSGGTDCTTPGFGGAGNTHSARTQYWNVSEIKMKGISYLPTNAWLQGQLEDIVNINQACNAYWSPFSLNLNFFKTGSIMLLDGSTLTCDNTGELPGVSLHEWGHGMDSNDGSGGGTDNVPIESRADWTALLQTHQSCTGNGFITGHSPAPPYGLNCGGYGNPCTGCTGVRDADYASHGTATAWTPQNKGTVWGTSQCSGGYTGPCGWEDHCESGVATQALWDFVNRDLVGAPTSLDLVTAWQLADRLFYTGMPQSTNMYTCTGGAVKVSNGCGAGSLYTVMRAIDDDGDGVGNGTPHAAAIFAALNRHGIGCGASGDPANQNQTSCPALTTPTLSATANNSQVTLNWTTGGASATRYFVFRNETGCDAGFTRIATVGSLSYNDTGVLRGVTYYYRVQAATANDSCVSPMSNCVTIVAELPADRDFYVRDWTESGASHDNGEEPSTHFQTNWAYSSDVWNMPTNASGSVNASDWYSTDNLYAGMGTLGDNYGFVRVSRNATGSTAMVPAEFLISPFGAGSNFGSVASTTVNFAAGDPSVVLGAYYHQDPTASTHACIAVQLNYPPDDPYKSDLAGHSPGDPDGQALILIDNNKAQRNLGVSHDVPHFVGLHYALLHNPALLARDMVIHYESPAGDKVLRGGQIQVVGGEAADFHSGGKIVLAGMQPGENRWIALRLTVPDTEVPVHFYDMDGDRVVNGFTLLVQPVPVTVAIRDNLRNHLQVFNRLAAAFGANGGKAEADAAAKLLEQKEITAKQYLGFLTQHAKPMGIALEPLVKRAGTDTFGILASLKAVADAAAAKQAEQAASEHGMLLNRLDSFATMLQKSEGDPGDILQMVRWQEALYRDRPVLSRLDCAKAVEKESQRFIEAYRKTRGKDYPELLRSLYECFVTTAKAPALQKNAQRLEAAIAAMERPGLSLAGLEKAHRDFLAILQESSLAGN